MAAPETSPTVDTSQRTSPDPSADPTLDSRLFEFLADIPGPGEHPLTRLQHTVACFAHVANTTTVVGTPLTWGDLRALAEGTRRPHLALAARTDLPDTDWVAVATRDVYGAGVVTGLTWGDLRALLATRSAA